MGRKEKRQGFVLLVFLLIDAIGISLGLKISLIQAWFYNKMPGSRSEKGLLLTIFMCLVWPKKKRKKRTLVWKVIMILLFFH